MPIHPDRMKLYPGGSIHSKEWREIRERILKRANDKCEGTPKFPQCRAENRKPHPETGSRVVLTIAHMDHEPAHCDDDNLKALCQRCHLTYDAEHHAANAAATRRAKLGNRELF